MDTKITKYTIASVVYAKPVESATYDKELENQVNGLIREGWQPFGGLQLVQRELALVALQPMVRMDPENGVALEVVEAATAGAR